MHLATEWGAEMRILVCGDRNWTDEATILRRLEEYRPIAREVVVIHGAARGADTLGRAIAEGLGYRILGFPANWRRYGRAAGPIRNQQMLDEGRPDLVLAFHNDIQNSRGTRDMVARARLAGIPVEVICEPK